MFFLLLACFIYFVAQGFPPIQNATEFQKMIVFYVNSLSPLYYPFISILFVLVSHDRACAFVDRVYIGDRIIYYNDGEIERVEVEKEVKQVEIKEEGGPVEHPEI